MKAFLESLFRDGFERARNVTAVYVKYPGDAGTFTACTYTCNKGRRFFFFPRIQRRPPTSESDDRVPAPEPDGRRQQPAAPGHRHLRSGDQQHSHPRRERRAEGWAATSRRREGPKTRIRKAERKGQRLPAPVRMARALPI